MRKKQNKKTDVFDSSTAFLKRKFRSVSGNLLVGALFLFCIAYLFSVLYEDVVFFDSPSFDGTFQLLNPLRRLAEGQVPGRDFFFFHGLGTLYLHYPFFLLFGANLFAVEFVKIFVSFTVGLLVNLLFFFSAGFTFIFALLFTLLFTLYCAPLRLGYLCSAGNSLLGIRTLFPLLLFIVLILISRRFPGNYSLKSRVALLTVCSLLLGFAFFFSVEHGFAAIIAFVSMILIFPFEKFGVVKRILYTALVFLGISVFTISIFYLAGGSSAFENIKYALFDIPQDQFWYFGAPPNDFLYSFGQFFDSYSGVGIDGGSVSVNFFSIPLRVFYTLFVLIPVIFYFFRKKYISRFATFAIGFVLLYGILSIISIFGIFITVYSEPLHRINLFVTLYLAFVLISTILKGKSKLRKFLPRCKLPFICVAIFIIFIKMNFGATFGKISSVYDFLRQTHINSGQYGVIFNDDWQAEYDVLTTFIMENELKGSVAKVTNENWINGVGVTEANNKSIILYSTSDLAKVKSGDSIQLPSGQRKITGVDRKGGFTFVSLDGEGALDAESDGYPSILSSLAGGDHKPDMWSTYAGLPEYTYDIHNPNTDYIIHALGKGKRMAYIQDFIESSPEFVYTLRASFTAYERWLQYSTWGFYEYLVAHYTPLTKTKERVLWKRDDNLSIGEINEVFLDIVPDSGEIDLKYLPPADTQGELIVVDLSYEIENPYSFIPFFGATPRYMVDPMETFNGLAVSLPPYENSFKFPLYVGAGQKPRIRAYVASLLPGVKLKIKGVSYHVLPVPFENALMLLGG